MDQQALCFDVSRLRLMVIVDKVSRDIMKEEGGSRKVRGASDLSLVAVDSFREHSLMMSQVFFFFFGVKNDLMNCVATMHNT